MLEEEVEEGEHERSGDDGDQPEDDEDQSEDDAPDDNRGSNSEPEIPVISEWMQCYEIFNESLYSNAAVIKVANMHFFFFAKLTLQQIKWFKTALNFDFWDYR